MLKVLKMLPGRRQVHTHPHMPRPAGSDLIDREVSRATVQLRQNSEATARTYLSRPEVSLMCALHVFLKYVSVSL